eukprot:CAMPEP_0177680186 /NCGR_PEP_ID=MMETSP0447-20121125/30030_1 /TAXON_ID=0 /ORGANISM="Stygamoeba regulata, Strain BSH-02190019" /LENGTH=651 /DNA_ID=CAMNT_0019189483 /DNA_START=72 /DNA_END=2027 /DNA_ORIENTATION=-
MPSEEEIKEGQKKKGPAFLYVIRFSVEKYKESRQTIDLLLQRLKEARIIVEAATGAEKRPAVQPGGPGEEVHFLHLSASAPTLLEEAERVRLPKPLKAGPSRHFKRKHLEEFVGCENPEEFFSFEEKQFLLRSVMDRQLVAREGEPWVSQVPPDEIVSGLVPEHPIIPHLQHTGLIDCFFPVHDTMLRRRMLLLRCCTDFVMRDSDLTALRLYLGDSVAWYFAWLSFYTQWLIVPSVFAVALSLLLIVTSSASGGDGILKTMSSSPTVNFLYAVFLCIWSTLFIEFWKRRTSVLAWHWSLSEEDDDEPQRPQFKGRLTTNEITGKPERFFPPRQAYITKWCVSLPAIMGMAALVAFLMLLIFTLETYLRANCHPDSYWHFLPIALICAEIQVMNMVYSRVATYLNDMENHETETAYQNHLIWKRVMFEYINGYGSFLYIAFVARDMERLQSQLIALLTLKQLVQNIPEAIVPLIQEKFRSRNDSGKLVSEVEAGMAPYEDTYDDWAEMMLQYGYILQFGIAFPLSALFSLINNLIELRSDLFKILFTTQRPPAKHAINIGVWQNVLEVISASAVLSNCMLLAFTSPDFLPDWSVPAKFGLAIACEHLILFVKYMLAEAIPDVPWEIEVQRRKERILLLNEKRQKESSAQAN